MTVRHEVAGLGEHKCNALMVCFFRPHLSSLQKSRSGATSGSFRWWCFSPEFLGGSVSPQVVTSDAHVAFFTLGELLPPLSHGCIANFFHVCKGFHNDKDRREFISAGTAAGLAAAFGAPVRGVLFSLEEASSFWSRKVMWRSLVCTSMATLVIAWLHDRGFSFALPSNLSFRLQVCGMQCY